MVWKFESRGVSVFFGVQFTAKRSTIELKLFALIYHIIYIQNTGIAGCIVGCLLYLAGNSRPDIAFAVHQTAWFSHGPKQSHTVALKQYLKGARD